jgi:hypothetical protein
MSGSAAGFLRGIRGDAMAPKPSWWKLVASHRSVWKEFVGFIVPDGVASH